MLCDAVDDVGQPSLWINIVEFGGLDERVHDRRTPSSGVGTSEEIILAAERDWANGAFGGVVAHFEAAITGKSRQGVPARGRVADGLCERTLAADLGECGFQEQLQFQPLPRRHHYVS